MSVSHHWELSQPEDGGLGFHSPSLQSLAQDALVAHKFPGPLPSHMTEQNKCQMAKGRSLKRSHRIYWEPKDKVSGGP